MTVLATIASIILVSACVYTMATQVWNIVEALTSGITVKVADREDNKVTYVNMQRAYAAR